MTPHPRADRSELLAERAAIMEFDGGLDRATAERRAELDVDGRLAPAVSLDAIEAARARLEHADRATLLTAYREGDAPTRNAARMLLTERTRGELTVATARPHRPLSQRYGRRRVDGAALAAGEGRA